MSFRQSHMREHIEPFASAAICLKMDGCPSYLLSSEVMISTMMTVCWSKFLHIFRYIVLKHLIFGDGKSEKRLTEKLRTQASKLEKLNLSDPILSLAEHSHCFLYSRHILQNYSPPRIIWYSGFRLRWREEFHYCYVTI